MRQYGVGRRVMTDQALTPRRRETDRERLERVANSGIREGPTPFRLLPSQPADEVGNHPGRQLAQAKICGEVPQRVALQVPPIVVAGLLAKATTAGAVVALDPV